VQFGNNGNISLRSFLKLTKADVSVSRITYVTAIECLNISLLISFHTTTIVLIKLYSTENTSMLVVSR